MASDESDRDGEDDTETERPERKPKVCRPFSPEEEPIFVFGGRLLIAVALLAAMVVIPMSSVGNLFEPKEEIAPTSAWSVGQTKTVAITLITADYNKLTCVSDKEF